MALIDKVLDKLESVKASGGNYVALCPAHDDNQRSLSVSEKDGRILLHCFTGCSPDDIVMAIGLEMKDLYAPTQDHKPIITKETVWDIVSHTGKVIAQHYRNDYSDGTKRYYWKRNGNIGLGGYKTSRLPLYGLRYLNGQTEYCVLTEGEKAADALNTAGIMAFATVCGASSTPSNESLEILSNFNTVYLWPDNDTPGIDHMTRIAGQLKSMGITALLIKWPDAPDKGDAYDYLDNGQADIKALLHTAVIWPPSQPVTDPAEDDPHRYGLTDTGNAERFARDHNGNVRFCPERGRWLLWDSTKWIWDNKSNSSALELSKITVRNIYHEVAEIEDMARRQDLIKFAALSESESRRRAMVNLAISEPNMVISATDIDTNNWHLNCKNGTVDLESGELMPHNKSDLNTKIIDIEYDPYAVCPTWMRFLDEVTNNDDELQAYLQKAIGYSLTGDIREQCLFFLYGRGQNGKSTFINTILFILGPYAHQADMDIFMLRDKYVSGPKEGLANLQGRRFVAATELEEGRRLATAMVKMVTGGEMITADRKHEHYISFWPTHKIWLSGNHKPRISDTTDSIWRRVKLIPFTTKISNPDEHLFQKLKSESAGILAWAIAGCMAWKSSGLSAPGSVVSATNRYRDDQDEIKEYLEEKCVTISTCKITTADLYKDYTEWAKSNGTTALGKQRFNGKVEEKGYIKQRGNYNKLEWLGIGLKTHHQEGYQV